MDKKSIIKCCAVVLVIAVCAVVFVKCSHKHSWRSATCLSPMMCVECGKTKGAVLKHSWSYATCIAPKHCKICGETVGTTGTHSWV